MELLAMTILLLLYLISLLAIRYYIDLFKSKENYTKSELTDILPYVKAVSGNIFKKYNFIGFIGSAFIGSLPAYFLTKGINHWFTNSAIIFAILFAIIGFSAKYFENNENRESGSLLNSVLEFIFAHRKVILFFYGLISTTVFTFNRISSHSILFIFFIINIAVSIVLMEILLKSLNE